MNRKLTDAIANITGLVALLALAFVCLPAVTRAQQAATPTPAPAQAATTPTPTPQPLPNTDIFAVDVVIAAGGEMKFGEPRALTTYEGYDNQPSFLPDGRALLYTSIRADSQADTYRYNFADGSTARLTSTPEGEYSPTVTPDKKFFSVIRVEKDSTQRLWKFPLAGTGQPSLVLEKFKPVGYHAWADARTLALFILGEPATLQVVDAPTGEFGVVAANIGRSLQRVPGKSPAVAYVHKLGAQEWLIKEYDTRTHAKRTLTRTLPDSEDFAFTPDGSILMAKDSKLYRWRPTGGDWQQVADFTAAGLRSITRLSVSPRGDRLALVAQRSPAAKN